MIGNKIDATNKLNISLWKILSKIVSGVKENGARRRRNNWIIQTNKDRNESFKRKWTRMNLHFRSLLEGRIGNVVLREDAYRLYIKTFKKMGIPDWIYRWFRQRFKLFYSPNNLIKSSETRSNENLLKLNLQ